MKVKHVWLVLFAVVLIACPVASVSGGELVEDTQTAVTGTNGSETIDNTTTKTATAEIDTDSEDNVLTSATGINALGGNDQVGNTAPLTATADSRIDIPMKYSSTKAEARSIGITGGTGNDGITNSGFITTQSIADSIIGNFLLMAADIGITGWPTESTADSTAIDGGGGIDSVTNSGSIYVYVEADSTVSQGSVSFVELPVDAFSLGDARTVSTATATGIKGGELYSTGGQPESLANSGVMTIHSLATATADKFIMEAVGAARVDGSTTADAGAVGIDGGSRNNIITNEKQMSVTAEAEASFAATQLKMKGLMTKALAKLFGLDVGKITTTATADATGIDGGLGDDTITTSGANQLIDVYGKATADTQEVTVAFSLSTGGGESSKAALPVVGALAAPAVAATAPSADSNEEGAYADADTVSVATSVGISGGSGRDTITSGAPLKARTESFATSTGVNADVSLSKTSNLPFPGAAVASTATAAEASSTGIDAGSGNDTIINSAALDAISYAESDATTVGAVIKGTLEGLALGVTVVDSSSSALATSKGVEGGSGDDTVTNTSVITSLATSKSDSDSVGVTATGGKVGMAFGVALADASTTSSAYSYGIDLGGEETRTRGVSPDTVNNYGTIDADAISTASVMSVAATFSAELEGVVGGVSAARGDGTSEAFVTGVRTGTGDDVITNAGEGYLSADASATSTSDVVAVTVSAAWKGVALGAALTDASTIATAEAMAIESGDGDDAITSSKSVVSNATATAVNDTITIDVSVAIKGFSAGVALSNTETNADATAEGIVAGKGDDDVLSTSSVQVEATANTAIDNITVNVAAAGAAMANASSNATAVAAGLDGGAGKDSLTNTGALGVTATSIITNTTTTANLSGFAQADVTTTATSTATGIKGGLASNGASLGDTIKNDYDGSITVTSDARINAYSYEVQGAGVAFAKTGGKGYSYATGIVSDILADTILNYGVLDVTAESTLNAIGFNFQLLGIQGGSAGINTIGTATGIDAGAGRNVVTNGSTGSIDVFADVETLAGSVIAGFSAGLVSAGTTADVTSRGIMTGADDDIINNYGLIDVSEAALGQAGAGAIGLLAVSLANSISSGTIEGINAGGGDDEITNGESGLITVGTVAAGHDALVKSDTEAIAYDFFSFVISTLGAKATVSGIVGGSGEDTITNSGRITVGDEDNWMVVGESLGAAGQIVGADSVYAGTTVNGTASGINGGSDNDTITNTLDGIIQVDARGYADVDSQGYVVFGLFLPLTAESSANGGTVSSGIMSGTGEDLVTNHGTIASSAYMLSDAWSSSDMPAGIESSPFAESHGTATADSSGVDLGSSDNTLLNYGLLTAQGTALTKSYAYADSDTLRTYGEAYALSTATAVGAAGGDQGNSVYNSDTGTISATATARTDDMAGNITQVVSDEEATAVAGEWDGKTQSWTPVTASATGVSLGSGDDIIINGGSILSSSLSDVWTNAYTSSYIRNAFSVARAVALAAAKGIAAGTGDNTVTNDGSVTVSAVGNAYPNTYSWSREAWLASSTDSIAQANADATGIEADGSITNSAEGDISVTARVTSNAYSNTESETAEATTDLEADAVGISSAEAQAQENAGVQHILNDGNITVAAVAGENAAGEISEMAYVYTELTVNNSLAEVHGTATTNAAGIAALSGPAEIVNNGTLQVDSRSRPYLRAYADAYYDNPTAKAYSTGVAGATGISAVVGDNNVYNYGNIEVNAGVLDAYAAGDTWSNWSGCSSLAETNATATATGIITGDGNDNIYNYESLVVSATADAESYAWADTRDNNIASEYETTTSNATAIATGIDAGAGENMVYNEGTLSVETKVMTYAHAGGGHASVTTSTEQLAESVGIAAGDDGNTIVNSGVINASASLGVMSVFTARATGILTGSGDDAIVNDGTIFTDELIWLLVLPLHVPGDAIDSGAGADTVTLLGGSDVTGRIDLGPGDDTLHFYGDALLTGGADGGEGTDRLVLDGHGSAAGTVAGFETAVKLGPGTFVLDTPPQVGMLQAREGVIQFQTGGGLFSGGILQSTIYGGAGCGSVDINGAATLAGGLEVVKGPGACTDGASFDILTADSITGDFDSTVLPQPTELLRFDLNRREDSLQVVASVEAFITQASTPNQAALARRMDTLLPFASGDLSVILGEFQSLDRSEYGQAFSSLSPESYDNATGATVGLAQQTGGALQLRMGNVRAGVIAKTYKERNEAVAAMLAYSGSVAALGTVPSIKERKAATPHGVWIDGFGQRADQSSSASFTGYNVKTGGLIGGFDHTVSENIIAGGSILYSNSSVKFDSEAGDSTVANIGGSLYGTYFTQQSYFDAALSYSHQQYETRRNVMVGAVRRTAQSEHDGGAFAVSVGGGHDFAPGAWRFGPFGALQYVSLHEEGFTESGAGAANLTTGGRDTDSLVSELGLRVGRAFTVKKATVVPELSVAWLYDFDMDDRTITAAFAGTPQSSFSIRGQEVEKHGVALKVGATVFADERFSFSVKYFGEFRNDYRAHGGAVEFRYDF